MAQLASRLSKLEREAAIVATVNPAPNAAALALALLSDAELDACIVARDRHDAGQELNAEDIAALTAWQRCESEAASIMALDGRVSKLERGYAPSGGECACVSKPGVSGYRVAYPDLEHAARGVVSDDVEICAVCGKVRPVITVVFDDEKDKVA